MHNIDCRTILRNSLHLPFPPDVVDPMFHFPYKKAIHSNCLQLQLNVSCLPPSTRETVINLVKKYWTIFDGHAVWIPVKNNECVIDTGNAPPIAVKKIHYGPKEIQIMRKAIAALSKVGHIHQIHNGWWLFKAIRAPKPHQEHIQDINNFVWRFYVDTSHLTP
jgi:hypothetical protein